MINTHYHQVGVMKKISGIRKLMKKTRYLKPVSFPPPKRDSEES